MEIGVNSEVFGVSWGEGIVTNFRNSGGGKGAPKI